VVCRLGLSRAVVVAAAAAAAAKEIPAQFFSIRYVLGLKVFM
jgi:hypothetical protein